MSSFFTILLVFTSCSVMALDPVGRVEKLEGDLFVFSDPQEQYDSKEIPAGKTHVLFKDKYWVATKLAVSDQVFLDDYLQCSVNCKALIRLSHGSQLLLNKNSQLKIGDQYVSKDQDPNYLDLILGGLRAIIIKGKAQPEYRSKSTVLGVRGTDFLMTTGVASTNVAVIEGEVAVKTRILGQETQERPIKQGQEAHIAQPTEQEISTLKALTPAEQAKKIEAYAVSPPKKISQAKIQEVKELSQTLVSEDAHLEKAEALAQKPPVTPKKHWLRGPIKVGVGEVLDMGFHRDAFFDDDFQYSTFNIFAEYDFYQKPYGFGLVFSVYNMDAWAFRNVGFKIKSIDSSSLAARAYYKFYPIRFNFNLLMGGSLELINSDPSMGPYKRHYDLYGFAPEIDSELPLGKYFALRGRAGYSFLVFTYPNENKIRTHSVTLGADLLVKF